MESKDRFRQFLEDLIQEGYSPWQITHYLRSKEITPTDWFFVGNAMGTMDRLITKYLTPLEKGQLLEWMVGKYKEQDEQG